MKLDARSRVKRSPTSAATSVPGGGGGVAIGGHGGRAREYDEPAGRGPPTIPRPRVSRPDAHRPEVHLSRPTAVVPLAALLLAGALSLGALAAETPSAAPDGARAPKL